MKSLQDTYTPNHECFGCGPANTQGLQLKSFPDGDGLIARWRGKPHHQSFQGMLNGGIAGALLDCHSNWTAIHALMVRDGAKEALPCVTAEYKVTFHQPIPASEEIVLRSTPQKIGKRSVQVDATLEVGGVVCARCEGVFVQIGKDHPAAKDW